MVEYHNNIQWSIYVFRNFFFLWLTTKFRYFFPISNDEIRDILLQRMMNFVIFSCNRLGNFAVFSIEGLKNFAIFSLRPTKRTWIFPATFAIITSDRLVKFSVFFCERLENFIVFSSDLWTNFFFTWSVDGIRSFQSQLRSTNFEIFPANVRWISRFFFRVIDWWISRFFPVTRGVKYLKIESVRVKSI